MRHATDDGCHAGLHSSAAIHLQRLAASTRTAMRSMLGSPGAICCRCTRWLGRGSRLPRVSIQPHQAVRLAGGGVCDAGLLQGLEALDSACSGGPGRSRTCHHQLPIHTNYQSNQCPTPSLLVFFIHLPRKNVTRVSPSHLPLTPSFPFKTHHHSQPGMPP